MDWFLYGNSLRHERVKDIFHETFWQNIFDKAYSTEIFDEVFSIQVLSESYYQILQIFSHKLHQKIFQISVYSHGLG